MSKRSDFVRTKKVILFGVILVLITSLNITGLYASKGTPEANIGITADVTAGNAEEFHAAVSAAMKEVKDIVKVRIENYDQKVYDINSAVNAILNDNVELFYIKDCTSSWMQDKGKSSGIITVNINYRYPKDDINRMKIELNNKTDSVISSAINADMNDNAKELMLHDYIVMNTINSYADLKLDSDITKLMEQLKDMKSLLGGSTPEELSTAYSVLVGGKGDDKGYARAMKLLLNKVGIECLIVEGDDDTWNIVKIEGDYYHLDASADKLKNDEGKEVLTHDYFNVSDKEMSMRCQWDTSIYPACTSNKCNYFYRNNTIVSNVDEFKAQTKKAIEDVKDSISIRVIEFDKTVYNISDTINTIANENPLLDDIAEWYWAENNSLGTVNVIFKYDLPKSEVISKRQKTEEKANDIIKTIIRPDMNDYSKVLAIHDYIIDHAVYDSENADKNTIPPEEHDAYGVLVKGIGVCDSYTEAMKLLLDKAGVECITVVGDETDGSDDAKNDIGHAWSIVKIGGSYYHIDATWDDAGEEYGSNKSKYYYFNVTDEEMKKTHVWDQTKYPACTSTEYNYFYKKNLVAKSQADVRNIIKNALNAKAGQLTFKIADFESGGYDLEQLIEDAFYRSKLRRLDGASWYTYKDLGIIDIEFEY